MDQHLEQDLCDARRNRDAAGAADREDGAPAFEHEGRRHAGRGADAGASAVRRITHAEIRRRCSRREVVEFVVQDDTAHLAFDLGAECGVDGRRKHHDVPLRVRCDQAMGAVVLADNIFTFKADNADKRRYVADPRNGFRAVVLPLKDGMEAAVYTGTGAPATKA